MMHLKERQRREIEFYRDSPHEKPDSGSLSNLIGKVGDGAVLRDCLNSYSEFIPENGRVLEIGAGQGWASCLFKRIFPECTVIATDISQYAIESIPLWERVWNTCLDGSYACKSYSTSEPDSSLDMVFCFASAHHFILQEETFEELYRILKPGGRVFYFYEPTTPPFWYPIAFARMNRKRDARIIEDVLKTGDVLSAACRRGFSGTADYYPSLLKRGPVESIYYLLLNYLPFLQKLLPCTVNFHFVKK
ncbi:MAG: hypothetical protein CVV64_11755 [Candidatus Wallbacteria bacterium HGW-Wallbacteria-1]|jgi:ubiquinone/menaquinone biosynthesis C-methylase UbiE|uniref:Methyltransferase type 11 domain-containing protein n=1 Tax=Candidatus Wallbacteria bacterium HGW-Wallbacteria-1 TaxID=2013854 RepID=A0A2N1PNU3_9BACT|nr:MAG: hypothetical protein CVV64_11755 [Candidatus Wallbacteria bacterium HGW-Wallbacteria-1]